MRRFARRLKRLALRREARLDRGRRLDLQGTIRRSVASGGTPLRLAWKDRRRVRPRLVLLLDVSRSMSPYSFFFLRLARALCLELADVHCFIFHTRITGVGEALHDPDPWRAQERLHLLADGWAGGTRIGECLDRFNRQHGSRLVHSRTGLIIVSDGYDTGEPELLAAALGALRRRARRHHLDQPAARSTRFQPGEPRHAGGAAPPRPFGRRRRPGEHRAYTARTLRGAAMTPDELLELARELNLRQEPYALVTVVRAVAPTSAYLGAQAIVLADGTLHGWIGGGCAKDVVIGSAQEAIRKGEPKLVRISNDRIQAEDDVEQYAMSCASNGTIELFIQPYSAHSALCVLGNTPAADEARFLAERLRIRLADTPDEAPVVLVATQGQGDEEALERALRSRAREVLMIASRRKAERLRSLMRMRGIGASDLARLSAPAGPDAGAKTPGEIALVAMVGVLALLRGRGAERTRAVAAEAPDLAPRPAAPAGPGRTFINPVCGVAVDTASPKHVEEYEGVAYYFCCDACLTTFRQDRAKYAALHRAAAARVPA